MDFPEQSMANVYTIPIENVGKYRVKISFGTKSECSAVGDTNTVHRANQARPSKEEPSEKSLLALARRQRRLDGLQLFEKTKLNR